MDIDEDMFEQFFSYMEQAVTDLEKHIAIFEASHGANKEALEDVYSLAHNLKGMGLTFGYNLLTDVGFLFCVYIKDKNGTNPLIFKDFHKVIQLIMEHRISGDGGDKGKAILTRMEEKIAL